MKVLVLADEESKVLWDYFKKEDYQDIDLIISCGDLKASYLSFLVTMLPVPVLYVHGNHDDKYEKNPPEGCICIEDDVYVYRGIRFVGLGGSMRYKPGTNQYSEKEMEKRVRKLKSKIKKKGGFDVLIAHAPAFGVHDGTDLCHRGFAAFNELIGEYHPAYFVHGHVHLNYGANIPREDRIGETTVVNAYEKYIIELPDVEEPAAKKAAWLPKIERTSPLYSIVSKFKN